LRVDVTIADVARLAGISRGTVSRVLNDRADVHALDSVKG